MREVLFHGKRLDNGEWVEGGYYLDPYPNKVYIVQWNSTGMGFADHIEVYPETMGQYTGLVDKNGGKIFEGDIVKCKHYYDDYDLTFEGHKIRNAYGKEIEKGSELCTYWRNYEVRMGDGRWVIRNGSDGHDVKQNYIQNHSVEVIGNIHDNPELVKEVPK